MTDYFEKAKDEILKDARTNGGVTPSHLLDALIATNEDLDVQHEQTIQLLDVAKQERQVLCHKVSDLELWQHDTQTTCAERVKKLISEEHEDRHGKHMEQHHNSDASFQQKFIWWWGSKVSYIVVAVLIVVLNIAINMIWFGRP